MRKLEVKGGWVKSAYIDFIRQGTLHGALAVHIEMGGDASKGSFEDVVDLVKQIREARLPVKKMVRFYGVLTDHDPNLTLLIKSLFDYGFELQCIIDDRMVYSWLQWMSWVIVKTHDNIVMTQSDELWYSPEQAPECDVTFPIRPGRMMFCYVTGHLSVEEVDRFVCASKHLWGLL